MYLPCATNTPFRYSSRLLLLFSGAKLKHISGHTRHFVPESFSPEALSPLDPIPKRHFTRPSCDWTTLNFSLIFFFYAPAPSLITSMSFDPYYDNVHVRENQIRNNFLYIFSHFIILLMRITSSLKLTQYFSLVRFIIYVTYTSIKLYVYAVVIYNSFKYKNEMLYSHMVTLLCFCIYLIINNVCRF